MTTEELIEELKKRDDLAIIMIYQPHEKRGWLDWWGITDEGAVQCLKWAAEKVEKKRLERLASSPDRIATVRAES